MVCCQHPAHLLITYIYSLAMVQVLLHLQKGSPEHLLSAYGEWFREIASSGHTSWHYYIFYEVIGDFVFWMAGQRHLAISRHTLSWA